MAIPAVGLGTGGINYPPEKGGLEMVFRTALDLGYRLFDLAREYQNEHIMGFVLNKLRLENFDRSEIFLQSKVWPTQLGFIPTSDALFTTLDELSSHYIDMYMLHWKSCNENIVWHHCETTIDEEATWKEVTASIIHLS